MQLAIQVYNEKCIGCRACTRTGCPAITFDKVSEKSKMNLELCVGCEVCLQVCPVKAIGKMGAYLKAIEIGMNLV